MPWVKAAIAACFHGRNLSCTLNADECVSRGCALQCAMLSPLFKVKDFSIRDFHRCGISLQWDDSQEPRDESSVETKQSDNEKKAPPLHSSEQQRFIFEPNAPLNSLRMITLRRSQSFTLHAFEN